MAAPLSRFISVSRELGTFLFNSVFIAQAATVVHNMDSGRPTKLEFAVQMTCESCAEKVRAALEGKPGVSSISIDVSKEEVLVEAALTSAEVQSLIESTGRRAVLKGIGGSERGVDHTGEEKTQLSHVKKTTATPYNSLHSITCMSIFT
ncbi:hypothetical protein ATANTOWER_027040 [Ataeniobius toweri]|uniref:HMA domain-containing protein n=1 Tax=Ataeniobius toweri TaxID=208326 RepID=A0ABU7BJS8_9TELE|nr:hypothetical protein [Ataeniobius toweri]